MYDASQLTTLAYNRCTNVALNLTLFDYPLSTKEIVSVKDKAPRKYTHLQYILYTSGPGHCKFIISATHCTGLW